MVYFTCVFVPIYLVKSMLNSYGTTQYSKKMFIPVIFIVALINTVTIQGVVFNQVNMVISGILFKPI